MSFRWRLLLGTGVAVLMTAAVYSVLGYFTFQRSLQVNIEESLESFGTAAQSALALGGGRPRLQLDPMTRTVFEEYSTSRFRVLQGEQVVLEFGGAFPLSDNGFAFSQIDLGDGFLLDIAFYDEESRGALRAYVQTGLLALPIALGFAVAVSLLLQQFLLRPVRGLQRATTQLSTQAFPEPIEVPAGDDELSHLAVSFNRMTASLQTFIERERSFTRYASHELRTPLSNMRVLLEGLKLGINTPEATWPELEVTLKRMETILSGLLTLTRSPHLRPEPILLDLVVRQVVESLPDEDRARVQVEDGGTCIALGQDDLIRQITSNLIGNALKFSRDRVEVRLSEGEVARLEVRDFGPGVPADSLAKLTEPFFRIDKRESGLGLGLALVRHVSVAMGGRLELENADPGLRAIVTLPRVDGFEATDVDREAVLHG